MSTASDIGKRPITESVPAGSEVRESPEFDRVQNEIGKLTSLAGDRVVNWSEVIPLCETILTQQGKDLLIASYLAGSLLEAEGPEGLDTGLGIVADLLQTYWDSLFPSLKRLRARRNAVQWLIDRISQKAAETSWPAQPVAGEVIDSIMRSLRAIDATLAEKDDEAPSMGPLLTLFDRLPRMEAETDAGAAPQTPPAAPSPSAGEPSPAPAALPSASPPSVAPPAATMPLADTQGKEQAAGVLGERISELAEWYQGIDLESQASYRLKRIAVWSAIDSAPSDQDGKTMVHGPQAQTVELMKRLEAAGSPPEIIRFCENQLGIQPFWLDVNRLAAKALGLAGSRFALARQAVEDETTRLLERLPRLCGLRFSNGQAFAEEATQIWLNGLSRTSTAQTSSSPGDPDASQAIDEAGALASSGKPIEAAARMQQEIARTDSAQQRYTLRLHLCEMLVAQGGPAKLAPFARLLLADIEHFALDQWRPDLALTGLQLAYRVLQSDADCRSETGSLLARITRLDPAMALNLLGAAKPL